MFQQAELVQEINHLRKFAWKLTNNSADAEDLLQSTVLRALEKKHLFQEDTNLFKWTSKIMFNLFVSNYRRKCKFETKYDPESYLENESIEAPQDTQAELSKVSDAMARLSDDHREILVLVCVQGMQYQEVASMLSIPVGTVRSRLSRARENLQALLDDPTLSASYIPAADRGVGYGEAA